MIEEAYKKSLRGYARLAGFMYLFVMAAFIAPFVVLSSFTAPGDFAQTAQNIAASEHLYRVAASIELIGAAAIILLSGALYALLKSVDSNLALFALFWRALEATLLSAVAVIRFAALENYTDTTNDLGVRELLRDLMSSGIVAASYIAFVCLAAGSAIFFYLLFKSRYIPRLLAAFGVLASVLMSVFAFAHLLVPEQAAALGALGMAPMGIAEIGTGLWLLIFGANFKHWNNTNRDTRPA
jgi:Domain of unknown function (DUF4386)